MTTEMPIPEHENVDLLRTAPVRLNVAPVTDEVSLLDLLIIIAERKRFVFAVTGGLRFARQRGFAAFALRYTATVTLLPPQQNTSISAALASQLGSLGGMAALAGGGLGLKNPNDMFVGMLRSRTVEDAMVQHFGLMQE